MWAEMTAIPDSARTALEKIVGSGRLFGANQIAMMDPGACAGNLDADLAVKPGTAQEISDILKLCAGAGIPVVPHGGRTGLAGASKSLPGHVVLLSDQLAALLEIDPVERVAIVGAGVTLQALQEAAADCGLTPGIDIAARGSATIGGMIGTNAGGMEAFRFGMMRDRLLGLEGVLADGTIVSDLARVTKANEGYDLKQLFCGSEGTLGVVTKAAIRLERLETKRQTSMLGLGSANDAIKVMRALQDRGTLLLVEIMWHRYAHKVANATGLSRILNFCDAPVYLVIEIAEDADGMMEALEPIIEDGLIHDAILAQNERERDEIWRIREDSFAAQREIPHPLWFDISVPLTGLDAYVAGLQKALAGIDPDIEFYALGHLADGNLHLTAARHTPFGEDDYTAVSVAVEQGLKKIGGAISAEHGIGTDKLATLARCVPEGNLTAMKLLKNALDPAGILNPGKVIPAGL